MSTSKVLFFVLFAACALSLMVVSGVPTMKVPLQNHITGGFKKLQNRNARFDMDCRQFSSDYDVAYHLPFQIMINPINYDWKKSIAYMDSTGTFITQLNLHDEDVVPLSIFCLKNLNSLDIRNMPFPNGKSFVRTSCHYITHLSGIVPDELGNLYQLGYLLIVNSTVVNMTERLGILSNLYSLTLDDCSLTRLPELRSNTRLSYVSLSSNKLSKIDGLNSVYRLTINNNLFTDVPILSTPSALQYLYMNDNPVKHMLTITSYADLRGLYLRNATLSAVPPTIDRLKKLQILDLSYNKLFYLPKNILSLTGLKQVNIQNNSFTSTDIQQFKAQFNASNPNMTLLS